MSAVTKTAIIRVSMAPYHAARLGSLSTNPRLALTAIQLSAHESFRAWTSSNADLGCVTETLVEGNYEGANRRLLRRRLVEVLNQLQPDAVVVAGDMEDGRMCAGN